jgi:6-phosphogluconolactonase
VIIARFGDLAAAAAALAEQLVATLQQGLAAHGNASLVLPGGRTPLPLFAGLKDAPLDWSRIAMTLTDERWVPESDPGSNAALLRRSLLSGRAGAARFIPLYDGSASAGGATGAVWQQLQSLRRPFDAVVLGMGEDGHFASLFPGNAALAAALDPYARPTCVAMRAPAAPVERVSLNLAALRQARRLFLLITGKAKQDLLLQASRRDSTGAWPVCALLALRHPLIEVYWAP